MHLKKIFALLGVLLCLAAQAWAEETQAVETQVVANSEAGEWLYESGSLRVTIHRRQDEAAKLVWYEAELFCSPESPLLAVSSNPEKPGSKFLNPERIARKNHLVFAVNDDYFGDRIYNKETPGIVIRGGKILYKKTYKSGSNALPNLDTMALYPDGSLKVYQSRELTAQDYIDQGATDVFSFGPYLIRAGTINPRLEGCYKNKEPRVGFGMIEPYHYLCVVAEGRHSRSKGVGLSWLADKMRELGAVEALNLDGGQTAALVFMGEKINTTGKFGAKANIRNLSGMLGAGASDLVKE